jgi:hypothetical protein
MDADLIIGLRAAKKGLALKGLNDFLRFQLLWRAIENQAEYGLTLLRNLGSRHHKLEECLAFLMCAREDAKVFVREAPPDHRQMKVVLYWSIVLTALLDGPDLSLDLKELQVRFHTSEHDSAPKYLLISS